MLIGSGVTALNDVTRELQQFVRTLARLTAYPDAGHSPNWEWPERIANDLAAFMKTTGQLLELPQS